MKKSLRSFFLIFVLLICVVPVLSACGGRNEPTKYQVKTAFLEAGFTVFLEVTDEMLAANMEWMIIMRKDYGTGFIRVSISRMSRRSDASFAATGFRHTGRSYYRRGNIIAYVTPRGENNANAWGLDPLRNI